MAIPILMPALSPTMTEGNLARWLVKEGDEISAGDVIAEIETDKATMEVEAVDEGILARIVVPAGSEGIAVNQPIAVILEEGEDDSAVDEALEKAGGGKPAAAEEPKAGKKEEADRKGEQEPAQAAKPQSAAQDAPATPAESAGADTAEAGPAPRRDGERIFSSPLARRIARDRGIDLAQVRGSGPHGRIVKADIEAHADKAPAEAAAPAAAEAPAAAPAMAAAPTENPYEPDFELQKLNNMRKTIARRLTESKQSVPHFYLSMDVELDELLALRKTLNDRADGAYKLSVNDMIIKAVGVALRKVPTANASFVGDSIKLYKRADVAVAVAIDGGLITPVVRDAGNKGLETISNEMKDLAVKAREGKLQPEEYQGGTFSISNLGMYGVTTFQAVINPPQACILAIGAGQQKPVVKDGAVQIATIMSATLSVDHRAVDGAIGAEFLSAFKGLIEEPLTMLL